MTQPKGPARCLYQPRTIVAPPAPIGSPKAVGAMRAIWGRPRAALAPLIATDRREFTQFYGDDNANINTANRRFLARKYNILMGGATGGGAYQPALYRATNPDLLSLAYLAFFNPDHTVWDGTIDPWLVAHGYDPELAKLHHNAGDLKIDGTTGDGTITSGNRVVTWFDTHGTTKYIINPTDPGIRAYLLDLLGSQQPSLNFTGAFLDMFGDNGMVVRKSNGSDMYHIRGVEHPVFGPGTTSWGQAIIDLLTWLKANLPASTFIQINTANRQSATQIGGDGVSWPTFNHECAAAAGAEHREQDNAIFLPQITGIWAYWRTAVRTYGNAVQVLSNNESLYNGSGETGQFTLTEGNYRNASLDNQALLDAGWWWGTSHRYISGAYRRAATERCSFLMAITDDPDLWIFTWSNLWQVDPRAEWIGIVDYDTGEPIDDDHVVEATGAWGTVYRREFERCWVYFRNQPSSNQGGGPADFYWDAGFTIRVTYDGSGDSRNAAQTITFPGGATGYLVRHDGTVDPTPRTTIDLRVCEGVIIAKAPTGGVVAASVAVTPATASLEAGGTVPLAAVASEADDMPLRLLTSFLWESADPAIATVSSSGLVTAVGNGTVEITATEASSGVTGSCEITVERQRTEWLRAADVTGKTDGQDVTSWPAANGTALTDVAGFPLQYVASGRGGKPAIKGDGNARRLQMTVAMPATIDLWLATKITGDGSSSFPRLFESSRYRMNLDVANRRLQFLAFWSTGAVQADTPNNSVPATGDLDIRVQYDSVGAPGAVRIWLNGVEQTVTITDTHSGSLAATGTLVVANRTAGDRGFAGQYSELEWYNVLLPDSEALTEAARLDAAYAGHF